MRVFKYALTICRRHPIYLIVYVGFLSLMGLFMTMGLFPNSESESFEEARVPFAVIDRDGSDLSRGVASYLSAQGDAIRLADERQALQDAVATGQVDYLVIVPAGYGDSFMEAAHGGISIPALEVVYSFESMAGVLADTQLNLYLGLVRSAAALDERASQAQAVAMADSAAAHDAAVETVSPPSSAAGSERFVFYLMWSAYPLTAAIIVATGLIMGAFNRVDSRRRLLVSPNSSLCVGFREFSAAAVVMVAVWAFIVGVGLVAFWESAATLPAPTLALMLVAELLYGATPLAIGFLLGQMGAKESVSNAVGNIAGMVFAFLGGAWISLSLLPAGVQLAAAFSPVYWLTEALTVCAEVGADPAAALMGALPCFGLLLLFSAAFFVVALVAGRLRRQSSEAGGNAAAARV